MIRHANLHARASPKLQDTECIAGDYRTDETATGTQREFPRREVRRG
jgi:hypothetical protein